MIGKSYKINGNSISKTTNNYQIGLTLVNWRKVNTSSEQSNIIGGIGVKLSPTFPRERLIPIEGIIIADTRVGLSKAMDYLDSLFELKTDYLNIEYLTFGIIDEQDREWETKMKIKDTIEYEINEDDYLDGANRTFRISLISSDPRMFSKIENLVEGIESAYGGIKLGIKLGAKLNSWSNAITCISTGNIASPVKFEIIANKTINTPLTILNIDTKEFIKIDDDFIVGDKLIIDTKTYEITKNGVNIKNKKIVGSTWLQIKGVTKFGIYDFDGGLKSNDLNIKIYFNNILL